MTIKNPATQAWLDQDDRRTADAIRAHGVLITYVGAQDECEACRAGVPGGKKSASHGAEDTPLAYTVGLHGIGHPELLVFGLDPTMSAHLLNDVAARIRVDGDLTPGDVLAFPGWRHRILVEHVPNPGEIVFAADRFYDRPPGFSVPVLQLSYDDMNGRFPDEPGYSRRAWIQPRPGAFRA